MSWPDRKCASQGAAIRPPNGCCHERISATDQAMPWASQFREALMPPWFRDDNRAAAGKVAGFVNLQPGLSGGRNNAGGRRGAALYSRSDRAGTTRCPRCALNIRRRQSAKDSPSVSGERNLVRSAPPDAYDLATGPRTWNAPAERPNRPGILCAGCVPANPRTHMRRGVGGRRERNRGKPCASRPRRRL